MNKKSQMALFSFLAYYGFLDPDVISLQNRVKNALISVKDDLEFSEVSWGPIAHEHHEVLSDSLVYIVKNSSNSQVPEYSLVIRGTNPFSISSWINQDLDVAGQTPWSRQSEHTNAGFAYISKATDTSLAIHRNLEDNGETVLSWVLNQVKISAIKLNVTGHSLGGLMSTTFGLWLYDELVNQNVIDKVDMSIYSFAGPTAGNNEFAEYTNEKLSGKYVCIENKNDIATHVWVEDDMKNILPGIYNPIYPGTFEEKMLESLTGDITGLGYSKIGNEEFVSKEFSGIFDTGIFKDYIMQAAYQHVVPYALFSFVRTPVRMIDVVINILHDLWMDIKDWWKDGKRTTLNDNEKEKMFEVIREEIYRYESEWK